MWFLHNFDLSKIMQMSGESNTNFNENKLGLCNMFLIGCFYGRLAFTLDLSMKTSWEVISSSNLSSSER